MIDNGNGRQHNGSLFVIVFYLEYYDRIHLKDRMRSIFYQYFKYGNVYCYLMENGNLITLPVHLIRIANVMVGGEPV